ncbi:MAG: hypothetical protein LUG98_02590 [Tannerellaceae bacterium]|nr:hypothetical protein [Tannerellaceae bacterium]
MAGRTDDMSPTLTFEDCSQWVITSLNAEAALYRTREERVFSEYSGKIVYKTLDKEAGFRVELKQPLILEEWDCIELWNYGDHWCWGEPHYSTAMKAYVIILDSQDQEYILPIVQAGYEGLIHKYWFLSHFKLQYPFQGPTRFAGYAFHCNEPDIGREHTIYLGNTYIFKEKLEPFTYKLLPDKLPFPLRKETIAPFIKDREGKSKVIINDEKVIFEYKSIHESFSYEMDSKEPFGELWLKEKNQKILLNQNGEIIFANQEKVNWEKNNQQLHNDTLCIHYTATGKNITSSFLCKYYLHQKSLIWIIEELAKEGTVEEIRLGSTVVKKDPRLVPVPFLVYNYSAHRPCILSANDWFYFPMFDWYYTNSSQFFAGNNRIEKEEAFYNGGVRYIPLINGKRNPLREKLFWNISKDVQEVLPTVDNPPSSMQKYQADRFWCIAGGDDLKKLGENVVLLRSKGIEKVSIRYHEDFWREKGESFTFCLEPNPRLTKDSLRNFVRFVQARDWRVGFYSNYTDLAPVNASWNRDKMKMGPKGEWEVAWSCTYAPKPHVAWEQQAFLPLASDRCSEPITRIVMCILLFLL